MNVYARTATSLQLSVLALASPAYTRADTFANAPKMEYPAEALTKCLTGKIVARFQIVNGVPTNIEVVESSPGDLYVKPFKDWLPRRYAWVKEVYGPNDPSLRVGEFKTTFNFEPCG